MLMRISWSKHTHVHTHTHMDFFEAVPGETSRILSCTYAGCDIHLTNSLLFLLAHPAASELDYAGWCLAQSGSLQVFQFLLPH